MFLSLLFAPPQVTYKHGCQIATQVCQWLLLCRRSAEIEFALSSQLDELMLCLPLISQFEQTIHIHSYHAGKAYCHVLLFLMLCRSHAAQNQWLRTEAESCQFKFYGVMLASWHWKPNAIHESRRVVMSCFHILWSLSPAKTDLVDSFHSLIQHISSCI